MFLVINFDKLKPQDQHERHQRSFTILTRRHVHRSKINFINVLHGHDSREFNFCASSYLCVKKLNIHYKPRIREQLAVFIVKIMFQLIRNGSHTCCREEDDKVFPREMA